MPLEKLTITEPDTFSRNCSPAIGPHDRNDIVPPTGPPALLGKAIQSEPADFGELYELYSPRIHQYIYGRTHDVLLAEDLTSRTFLNAYEAVVSDVGPKHSVGGWLFRISHNLIIDHYKRKVEEYVAEHMPDTHSHDAFSHIEKSAFPYPLRNALAYLTPGQYQVIMLRFSEGLTVRSTAEIMKKTEGSVKTMQHRAIVKLREQFHPYMDES